MLVRERGLAMELGWSLMDKHHMLHFKASIGGPAYYRAWRSYTGCFAMEQLIPFLLRTQVIRLLGTS